MSAGWSYTGRTVQVPGHVDRIPPFGGTHLWVVLTAHRVDPDRWEGTGPPILDQETLISLQGPACLHCEQSWSTGLAARRCKGSP